MRRSERVYHDLTESIEYVELLDTRFYFSSSFNKERFLNGYIPFIKEEENKIISKYGIKISLRFYLLLAYYIKIEKRGFHVLRYSEKEKSFTKEITKDDIIITEFVYEV